MIIHEATDEVVAMVVAGMPAQRQRLSDRCAGGFKQMGVKLLGQKLVGQALVDQQRGQAVAGLDQFGGVVRGPGHSVVAQVAGNALMPHGHCMGAAIGAKADTLRYCPGWRSASVRAP